MKRAVAAALGYAVFVGHAAGEGWTWLSNYYATYNQVVWADSVPTVGGTAVNDTSVQIQAWYGEGVISDDSLLVPGEVFTINPAYTGNPYPISGPIDYGPGGFFDSILQVLPTFDPGDTFTFQLRAYGDTPYGIIDEGPSRSPLWQESSSITYQPPDSVPYPPGVTENTARLTVYVIPEPTTLSLLGLGTLALVIGRPRRQP